MEAILARMRELNPADEAHWSDEKAAEFALLASRMEEITRERRERLGPE